MSDVAVYVEGLNAFRRQCNEAGNNIDKRLKEINVTISDQIIDVARGYAAGVNLQAEKTAEALKPYRSAVAGGINLRATPQTPYAMGSEFGANPDDERVSASGRRYIGYRQFQPWRGSGEGAGYFVWPAIRQADVFTQYQTALDALINDLAIGGE